MKVIIDTDPGHDDALAIMLAVKSGIDVQAITPVAGNSTVENTTRNARFILKLLAREGIPVYSGASKPLRRELIKAVVHGESGLEGINVNLRSRLSGDAAEKIIQIVKQNSAGQITLIALGPLTNIAQAVLRDAVTMTKIREIIIMGGAISVPGNKNRVAEFNIFVDPEAADIVFRFPIKKTLVPLDACNDIVMALGEFGKIKNSALRSPILKMIRAYIKNLSKRGLAKGALLYDPLAVYCALQPAACKKKSMDLVIETKGEATRGMTVVERRRGKTKPNIKVVQQIDKDKFKKDFIKYLSL